MKRLAQISGQYIVNVTLGKDDAELGPDQMLEADALAAGYTYPPVQPLEILSKRWPDAEAFVAEFTLPEMAAIGLSTEPTIAALRFLLSSWRSQVISDDPRVQAGLDALVQTAIISEQRRAEILS
jgi:hypothetical protein